MAVNFLLKSLTNCYTQSFEIKIDDISVTSAFIYPLNSVESKREFQEFGGVQECRRLIGKNEEEETKGEN